MCIQRMKIQPLATAHFFYFIIMTYRVFLIHSLFISVTAITTIFMMIRLFCKKDFYFKILYIYSFIYAMNRQQNFR